MANMSVEWKHLRLYEGKDLYGWKHFTTKRNHALNTFVAETAGDPVGFNAKLTFSSFGGLVSFKCQDVFHGPDSKVQQMIFKSDLKCHKYLLHAEPIRKAIFTPFLDDAKNKLMMFLDGDIDFLQGHEFSYDTVKNMTWRQLAKILKEHAHFDVIEIFQEHTQFIGSRSEVNYKKKVKSNFGAPKKADCKAAPKPALKAIGMAKRKVKPVEKRKVKPVEKRKVKHPDSKKKSK